LRRGPRRRPPPVSIVDRPWTTVRGHNAVPTLILEVRGERPRLLARLLDSQHFVKRSLVFSFSMAASSAFLARMWAVLIFECALNLHRVLALAPGGGALLELGRARSLDMTSSAPRTFRGKGRGTCRIPRTISSSSSPTSGPRTGGPSLATSSRHVDIPHGSDEVLLHFLRGVTRIKRGIHRRFLFLRQDDVIELRLCLRWPQ